MHSFSIGWAAGEGKGGEKPKTSGEQLHWPSYQKLLSFPLLSSSLFSSPLLSLRLLFCPLLSLRMVPFSIS